MGNGSSVVWSADVHAKSEAQTQALGRKVGARLRPGDVVALHGDLGAGKTTFARGAVAGFLGEETETPSPTFSLVQIYERGADRLWHFDLYRLDRPSEIWELGWEEAMEDSALVEWPDRGGDVLPKDLLNVFLSPEDGGRRIRLTGARRWADLAP